MIVNFVACMHVPVDRPGNLPQPDHQHVREAGSLAGYMFVCERKTLFLTKNLRASEQAAR